MNWNAAAFFELLTKSNKLAAAKGFAFARVSSLDGFEELISRALSVKAYVAVSDSSQGSISLANSPHSRHVKTVFLFMRHKEGDMPARENCLATMRELFRQLMSALVLEKNRLAEGCIYIDDNISFTEIDRYFFTGGACAYFQIAVDTYVNLQYDREEWQ